jgi:hypothetical protein
MMDANTLHPCLQTTQKFYCPPLLWYHTFSPLWIEASNQKLNLTKIEVLHHAPDPPPHAPHALTVVEAATSLGICFSLSNTLAQAHWPESQGTK